MTTHHGHTIYLNGVYLDLSAEACTNCPPQRVEVTASGESHFFYRYYLTIFHRWSERVVNRDARLARDQRDPRDFSWRTGILPYVQLSVTGIVEVVVQNGDEGSEIARVHFNINEYNDDTEQRGWVTGIMKWSQSGQLEEALAQFNQTYEDTIDSPALLQSLVPVALNHMDHSALIRFLALPVPSTHYLR